MLSCAVGQHGPNLPLTILKVLKGDMAAIRRPCGKIVAPNVMGKLNPAMAGNIHDVNILSARSAGAVAAIPRKG